jgi:hypothetical protein
MIELGMRVTDGDICGTVESINTDHYGNTFVLVGWGKELNLYNNTTVNIKHLRELNW